MTNTSQWVDIGVISYDADADIIASIFESAGIPIVIQGRNHRRMMGFLYAQVITMRLLVPHEHQERAQELFTDYQARRDQEIPLESHSESPESPEDAHQDQSSWLFFNRTGQKMGASLFLAIFLGFGLASLAAGIGLATLILAPLQICCYWGTSAAWMGQQLGLSPDVITSRGPTAIAILDLIVAWSFLIIRALLPTDQRDN